MTTLRTIIILTLSLISTVSTVTGQNFNITDILSEFPEYTEFNKFLSVTKLNDEINSRHTLTVLVLNNTSVTKFLANQPLSVVKTALSIHVLLDFFDMPKLLSIGGGSMTSTTLYQTTGNAAGSTGFVNITDLVGNKVGFGSGQGSTKLDSLYSKTVKSLPYNISVLEITSPIIAPGILMTTGKAPLPVNITSVLEQAGCKTFARLVSETGVWKVYQGAEPNGLTVFAPTDAAFKATGLPNLGKMTNTEFISLLLYHAIPSYVPKVSLKNEVDPVSTLASNEVEKFYMSILTNGDSATLSSGIDDSRVESMVFDSVPICVFRINTILLPSNFFTKSPSPAPIPVLAPKTSTTAEPAPESESAPAPRTIASTPSPVGTTSPIISPPAPVDPSTLSPDGVPAPADGPTADIGDTKTSEACGGVKASVMFLALVMVSISGIVVA